MVWFLLILAWCPACVFGGIACLLQADSLVGATIIRFLPTNLALNQEGPVV